MVKQNIVFVENTPGSLQKVTKILAENQIDIYGFGCFPYGMRQSGKSR